ncbi:MAG: hypothetical protein NUV81_00175 [bacterium]|nr:hypothetical protein [bacterium]
MNNWKSTLRSLGFTESETNIYLASLKEGPSAVQDLAQRANVSRVTAYGAIESLMKSGLMSTMRKGKKTLYTAESPERLVAFVQTRVGDMEATLRDMKSSIDDLKLMQRGEKPVVKLFEGREALKALQDDVVSAKPKQIDEFGNLDEILNVYTREDLQEFYKKLNKLKPRMRGFYRALREPVKTRNGESKVVHLPIKNADFGGDIFVYGSTVAFSTFRGKQISVLIESQELADTFRALFDELWSCKRTK